MILCQKLPQHIFFFLFTQFIGFWIWKVKQYISTGPSKFSLFLKLFFRLTFTQLSLPQLKNNVKRLNLCFGYETYTFSVKLQGYGFAEPYNIHATLLDLVIHYSRQSLVDHNEVLTTILETPVGAVKQENVVYVPMNQKQTKTNIVIKSSRRPSVYWREHSGGKIWNYDCIVVFLMSISTLVDKLIITLCNSGFFEKEKEIPTENQIAQHFVNIHQEIFTANSNSHRHQYCVNLIHRLLNIWTTLQLILVSWAA